jgi:hypothetical protein
MLGGVLRLTFKVCDVLTARIGLAKCGGEKPLLQQLSLYYLQKLFFSILINLQKTLSLTLINLQKSPLYNLIISTAVTMFVFDYSTVADRLELD